MAQPNPEQQPLTDDELTEGRERLKEFFDTVADDLADKTDQPGEQRDQQGFS